MKLMLCDGVMSYSAETLATLADTRRESISAGCETIDNTLRRSSTIRFLSCTIVFRSCIDRFPGTWVAVMRTIISLLPLIGLATSHYHNVERRSSQVPISEAQLTINGIPYSTRAHWMRRANQALSDLVSPCPFGAFGTVIVNHTDTSGLGELVCIGANSISSTGNPTLHGQSICPNDKTMP